MMRVRLGSEDLKVSVKHVHMENGADAFVSL